MKNNSIKRTVLPERNRNRQFSWRTGQTMENELSTPPSVVKKRTNETIGPKTSKNQIKKRNDRLYSIRIQIHIVLSGYSATYPAYGV